MEDYLIYLRHLFSYIYAKRIVSNNFKILEVDSGEGYGSLIISNNNSKYIGLDIDEQTVEHFQNKYGNTSREFILYNGFDLPFKNNSFDIVISFQVIEHVESLPKYLSEIYRVLKRNGTYILTTPNRAYRLNAGQKPWNKHRLREFGKLVVRPSKIVSYTG
jgi:ubiquinone/menaquinone biosynthesis C-methylase UbiE